MDFYNVLIERDASTKVPLVLPEYEIPVLQAVHGESRVHLGAKAEDPRPGRGFDPGEAYGALLRKYRQDAGAVRHVYPSAGVLARMFPPEAPAEAQASPAEEI